MDDRTTEERFADLDARVSSLNSRVSNLEAKAPASGYVMGAGDSSSSAGSSIGAPANVDARVSAHTAVIVEKHLAAVGEVYPGATDDLIQLKALKLACEPQG